MKNNVRMAVLRNPQRGSGPGGEGRAHARHRGGCRTWLSRPPHVPQAACQPGCQNPSSRLLSLSQAWHVFTSLAGRDDSPEQMLQLRYFLNENLCFVLIQIYKGRGEISKSPYWSWLSNDPRGCGIKTATIFPLTSPKLSRNTRCCPRSPPYHPRGIWHFYTALPGICRSPDALAALPVVLWPSLPFPG